jgi:pimeloyl-ACP methyl ester carboxylesterase
VTFTNHEAGITLAGTLTMPARGRHFPAVVLLTGSGAQNRDEEILGHRPFLVLADHLTRRGIAVLRFDDRGIGGSGGDPTTATTADFATDAAAAIDYLRSRREINRQKIGMAGHSEGAAIAFMTAADHPEKAAYVVSMGGVGVGGLEISVMQFEDSARAQGMSEEMARMYGEKQRRDLTTFMSLDPEVIESRTDSVAALIVPGFNFLTDEIKQKARIQIRGSNSPWARFFMTHDFTGDITRVKCPVLAVGGDKDRQVRSSVNLPAIRAALEAGGNTRITTTEYPNLNHLFQTTETGRIDEYATIEETFSPRVMEDIADWILQTVR